MKELVSIIIPAYNRKHLISRAINSVLNQTYSNIEVIIVDDCSTDNTDTYMYLTYGKDKRVKYIKLEQNSGACIARNRGIKEAKGTFIGFLDSDDEYVSDKIECQINTIINNKVDLCATNFIRKYDNGKQEHIKVISPSRDIYNELLYSNFITTGTLFGYKYCFENNLFDKDLPRFQDWDIVLRLSKKYKIFLLQKNTLLQYYQTQSITASTSYEKTLKSLLIIKKKNKEEYLTNQKANTQINWLIGVNSMFTNNKLYSKLWNGVVGNGFSFKRFCIFIIFILGLRRVFSKSI